MKQVRSSIHIAHNHVTFFSWLYSSSLYDSHMFVARVMLSSFVFRVIRIFKLYFQKCPCFSRINEVTHLPPAFTPSMGCVWHRHQIEGTIAFYFLFQKTQFLAMQGEQNWLQFKNHQSMHSAVLFDHW